MKKVFSMIMVAAMFSLVACGPSEEEKAAAQAEAETAVNDLMNNLEEPATEATAETATTEAAPADATTEAAPAEAAPAK